MKKYNTFIFEQAIEMVEFTSKDMTTLFKDADILESIITDSESLLQSIRAEAVDFYTTFGLNKSNYNDDLSIEDISEDKEFNKALQRMKLQKNEINSTVDYQTFIEKSIDIKFFSIFGRKEIELETPDYIFFQSKKKTDTTWQPLKCYKVNENMSHFYDKLTSKTIEIKKDGKTYIYSTSNSGNNWNLKNIEDKDDTFKDSMENDDIKAVLKDKGVTITIMA